MKDVLARRRAGALLHVTSLPGPYECGTLGADARRFVDFLVAAGFSVWQTLPLGPADEQGSPYCLRSVHAGDPRLIDEPGLRELEALPERMAFDAVREAPLEAYRSFRASASLSQLAELAEFARRQRRWLLPYALFELCAQRFDRAPWWQWPAVLRDRSRPALAALKRAELARFRATVFAQYLFALQWAQLKDYANARGVYLFGDLPFYVDRDSVDVWWQPSLFQLDALGRPESVAGVPPDYFNEDGQLWGNPLYDWQAMARDGFAWWLERLEAQLERFDLLRIDHFRALQSYWAVPATARTARAGRWCRGAGDALLGALTARYGKAPLVAEDLGIITDEVRALRDRFELPGMAVLQFAFDGSSDNPHLPGNCGPNTVIYTGTHDNDTTLSWYRGLEDTTRAAIAAALGPETLEVPESFIEAAYGSEARLAVIPVQDLLGLGGEARMNTPGTVEGNWRWRFAWSAVHPALAGRSQQRARRYGRWPCDASPA